ncbi:MAG: cystathionine beta-lyase [Phyllobacteriaceae bacterium]|jgi:cystathionine beta-lyase|nr:cystathionine beta-lyase [Phyllobacteriaceae bacterium]
MAKNKSDRSQLKSATRIATMARQYAEHGMVNPAVYRASTITFPDVNTLLTRNQEYLYGRRGTPTSRAFETAVAELEGGHDCKACPSGLAAISSALLSFLSAGDHLLMVDTVYHPASQFCDTVLKRLGIETTYYDPLIGKGIAALIRPNTRVVYCESPGSQTMEIQDVPAIVEAAHSKGAIVMLDNTWSGGHYFKAFAMGCDVSIQAATKYLVGHSDAMLGTVTCNEKTWPQFKDAYETMGLFAGPDDMYLALRGMRTLDVRLERHMRSALTVAEWMRARPEVETVLHPGLSNAPGHSIWRRDFSGSSGLFSVVLKSTSEAAVAALLDGLELFSMGYSWGGFESLVVPFVPHRTATTWTSKGICLRFHVGLEHPDDLLKDLEAGFERLNAHA